MKATEQTLLEQLRINSAAIRRRKEYLNLTREDVESLKAMRPDIIESISDIIEEFYAHITGFNEMDQVIGDSETLSRLKNHQYHYILALFDGQYDLEYVHSRLRVGVVHKRINLDPKFYISTIHLLNTLLRKYASGGKTPDCEVCHKNMSSIEKILMFDLTLTIDTYINSLMQEARHSREKLEEYTASLEEIVAERTKSLQDLARHDGLTGLINQHTFYVELKRELSRAKRLNYSVTLLYFDLDGFKLLNDTQGHKAGDDVLKAVAEAMRETVRENEISARYGGDEFCVLLSATDESGARVVADRLCDAIKKHTKGTGVTASIGLATAGPETTIDSDSLVKAADKAMYEAKKEEGFIIRVASGL